MPPQRVVSLLPAATEIVCALGAGQRLTGVSHECDFPAAVQDLPRLTSSKVAFSPSSGQIDRDVRAIVRDALGVYDIDLEALRVAAPDVIVTQALCDVCAVSLTDVERAVHAVLSPEVEIVSLEPMRLGDVWNDVRRVASALDLESEGARVVAELEARIAGVAERAAALSERPRVLTIEWLDPVMVGGTWMPELVELAGGKALVTQPGDHAPTLDLAALRALEPDVVVVKPCGFKLERTRAERDVLDALLARTDWPATAAGRVWIADGNAYFNRPGPRLVESLEILAACAHPAAFAELARRHAAAFERFPG